MAHALTSLLAERWQRDEPLALPPADSSDGLLELVAGLREQLQQEREEKMERELELQQQLGDAHAKAEAALASKRFVQQRLRQLEASLQLATAEQAEAAAMACHEADLAAFAQEQARILAHKLKQCMLRLGELGEPLPETLALPVGTLASGFGTADRPDAQLQARLQDAENQVSALTFRLEGLQRGLLTVQEAVGSAAPVWSDAPEQLDDLGAAVHAVDACHDAVKRTSVAGTPGAFLLEGERRDRAQTAPGPDLRRGSWWSG